MDLMSLLGPAMTSPLLYPLLAGLCSLDGVLPMIPSEAAVLTAGVFAHAGTPSLVLVVLATALGVVLGDHLAYGLSRSVLGPRLINRSRHVSRAVAAAGRQLDRRTGLLIVMSRFLPGGRVTMNLACGTAGLPLARFTPASAVAALAWAAYTAGLGLLGGAAFVENPLLGLGVGLGLSFALGGIVGLLRRRISNRKTRPRHPVETLSATGEVVRQPGGTRMEPLRHCTRMTLGVSTIAVCDDSVAVADRTGGRDAPAEDLRHVRAGGSRRGRVRDAGAGRAEGLRP